MPRDGHPARSTDPKTNTAAAWSKPEGALRKKVKAHEGL